MSFSFTTRRRRVLGLLPNFLPPVVCLSLLVVGLVTTLPGPALGLEFASGREERDYRTARGLLEEGDHELARHQFRSFLGEYPESEARGQALVGLATTYYKDGSFDSAARYYVRALAENHLDTGPTTVALENGLESSLRSGQIDPVGRFLDRFQELRGDTGTRQRFRSLSRRWEDRGDTSLPLEVARHQVKEHPESPFWKYELALLYARSKQYDRALPLLDGLGEPWTQLRYDATLTKAEIQLQQGKLDAAETRYQFLLRYDVHVEDARYGLAWVAIERGDRRRARDYLALVTHAEGSLRARAARDLARIHREDNERELARAWYQHALRWAEDDLRERINRELSRYEETNANS